MEVFAFVIGRIRLHTLFRPGPGGYFFGADEYEYHERGEP